MTNERIRHASEKKEPRFKCPFPDCGKLFWKEPGKPDACPAHRQLIADVVHILNHLKPKSEGAVEGPSLLIPRPGMEGKAIQEALDQRGKIK